MSTLENFLDTTISDEGLGRLDSEPFLSENTGDSIQVSFVEPGYQGSIDYRIRQLSYSSLLTLHTCPRKFQLNRLRATHRAEEDIKSTVTFAFGHIVGEAIQLALTPGVTEEEIIWRMFLGWHTDLANSDDKSEKSFWTAVFALQKFLSLQKSGFLKEYDLVYYNDKPACELSFAIVFPDGFRFRGFVDAVLKHRETGEILVLECKTTGANTLNPATYKNSSQAIGYSVVLDHIFPDLSSYKVLYLVYQTKQKEYTPIPFIKTFLQRALWIRELLLDIEVIKMYEQEGIYPMHGESCLEFFTECEYFQTCTLSTDYLIKPCTPQEEDKTEYQIVLGLEDLLDSQLRKVE